MNQKIMKNVFGLRIFTQNGNIIMLLHASVVLEPDNVSNSTQSFESFVYSVK